MTPAEFEWRQEQLEIAYERGVITAGDFRAEMNKLGFSDWIIDQYLDPSLDEQPPEKS